MSSRCPRCNSPKVTFSRQAMKITATIGTIGGAVQGAAGAIVGSRIGARLCALSTLAHPLGSLAGRILGSLAGGVAGCVFGAQLGVTAPQTTPSSEVKAHRCCAPDFPGAQPMMRPDPKVKAVYLYPKPVDFRKSINGLAALVELDIKVAVFDPALFVFLNRTRNQVKILYWHRNGFCLWLKRLEAERFKTKPDAGDEAIELTVRELNQLLEGIDLWGNQPHKVLTPRFVT